MHIYNTMVKGEETNIVTLSIKEKWNQTNIQTESNHSPKFYSHSEERESYQEQEQTSIVSHFNQHHHFVILLPPHIY